MRTKPSIDVLHNPTGFYICGGGALVLGMVPAGHPMPAPELLCAEAAELAAVFCDAGAVDAGGEAGFVELGLLGGVPFAFCPEEFGFAAGAGMAVPFAGAQVRPGGLLGVVVCTLPAGVEEAGCVPFC